VEEEKQEGAAMGSDDAPIGLRGINFFILAFQLHLSI